MSKTIRKANKQRSEPTEVPTADPSATVALAGEHGCKAACSSNVLPADDDEVAIRVRAHSKWEAAGCPAGDGFDFWLNAEREVNAERSGSSPAQG